MFDCQSSGFPRLDVGDSGLEVRLLTTAAGASLAILLEGIERAVLGAADRVDVLQARALLLAHVQAELYADVTWVGDAVGGGDRWASGRGPGVV